MWAAFYAPTICLITFVCLSLLASKLVVLRVQTKAFTGAKLKYLHNVYITLISEASVLFLLLMAFYLASCITNQVGGAGDVVSGVLVGMDLCLWALLNMYLDMGRWFRHKEDGTVTDLNAELRANLFGNLVEQIYLEYRDSQGTLRTSQRYSYYNKVDKMPSRQEMRMFQDLRRFWEIEEGYDDTFKTLHDISEANKESGHIHRELYTETVDHGGASGAFMFNLTNSDKYIIKTITQEEAAFFLKTILPKYHSRMLHDRYKRQSCPRCHGRGVSTAANATQSADRSALNAPLLSSGQCEHWIRCDHRGGCQTPEMADSVGPLGECGHGYCSYHGDAHPQNESCKEYEEREDASQVLNQATPSVLLESLLTHPAMTARFLLPPSLILLPPSPLTLTVLGENAR